MRRREEIEWGYKPEASDYRRERMVFEVLLDIRELLEDIKDGRRE